MTNEEAKCYIRTLLEIGGCDGFDYKQKEALDLAIKALEQQPCIEDYPTCTECEHYDKEKHYCPRFCQVIKDTLAEAQSTDAVSRQAVINTIFYKSDNSCDVVLSTDLMDRIKHLPSVTPQASEEDIHREREQAYMLGYEDASKKFRTEPSEDCISRKQALDDKGLAVFHRYDDYVKMRNYLKALPPVTPQRPKGKWIMHKHEMLMICTNCEEEIWYMGRRDFKYCPNCGAEMEVEE